MPNPTLPGGLWEVCLVVGGRDPRFQGSNPTCKVCKHCHFLLQLSSFNVCCHHHCPCHCNIWKCWYEWRPVSCVVALGLIPLLPHCLCLTYKNIALQRRIQCFYCSHWIFAFLSNKPTLSHPAAFCFQQRDHHKAGLWNVRICWFCHPWQFSITPSLFIWGYIDHLPW